MTLSILIASGLLAVQPYEMLTIRAGPTSLSKRLC